MSPTDWILIGGFAALFVALNRIFEMLKDIHAELMNVESHLSRAGTDNEPPI